MQICTNDVLQYHCFLWRRSFFKECEKVGVYGVIIPDLPYELTQKLKHKISKFDVKVISLISMTANDDRIKEIVKHVKGLYTL